MIETVIESARTISTHCDAHPDTKTLASKLATLAAGYQQRPTEKVRIECLRLSRAIYDRTRERTGPDLYSAALSIFGGKSVDEVFA